MSVTLSFASTSTWKDCVGLFDNGSFLCDAIVGHCERIALEAPGTLKKNIVKGNFVRGALAQHGGLKNYDVTSLTRDGVGVRCKSCSQGQSLPVPVKSALRLTPVIVVVVEPL